MFVYQCCHHSDGLTRCFGSLQCYVYQTSVVHYSVWFAQFGAAAECGFGYGQLVFVHVAYYVVRAADLRYASQKMSRNVPFVNVEHCAFGILGCGVVVQFAEKLVRVGRICQHCRAVLRGSFCHQYVGAGRGNDVRCRQCECCENDFP